MRIRFSHIAQLQVAMTASERGEFLRDLTWDSLVARDPGGQDDGTVNRLVATAMRRDDSRISFRLRRRGKGTGNEPAGCGSPT
jgi:hypothetical protein